MLALTLQGTAAVRPDSLSLAEALGRALAHRPVTAGASALVAEARAGTRVAGTIPDPTLSFSWTGDAPQRHAIVDQPLDWLLRRGPARAAGRAGEARAAADSVVLMAGVARDVRVAFYDALAGRESLRLTDDAAALADSLAEAANARLQAGDISVLERDQVAQEAARARYAVSQAREDAQVAAAALVRAVGDADTTRLAPVGALDDGLDAGIPGPTPGDTPPAVRAAVADSAASAELARAARVGQLPIPDLQAGAEWRNPGDPSEGTTSVIGLVVPIPLWNHGGGAAAAARARAARDASAAAEARLESARAVRAATLRLEGAAARARFDRDSLYPAARALRDRALAAYRAGQTGVLPVFDAMRGERDAALALIRDLVSFQDAVAERNALLGRTE